MEFLHTALDWFLHLDHHLKYLVEQFGPWTYGILSAVVFSETGLVVTPFLPGDSLLFATGALAATGALNVHLLAVLLFISAVLGNTVNYWIGRWFGLGISKSRWVKKEYLERAHTFYEKHGGKTVVFSRFLPILRTFAPFVAGISKMNQLHFFLYNTVSAVVWVALFMYGGYFFGNLPVIKRNFTLVILAIIVLSLIPAVWEAIRMKRGVGEKKKKSSGTR